MKILAILMKPLIILKDILDPNHWASKIGEKSELDSDMGLKSLLGRLWYNVGTIVGSIFDPKSILNRC